MTQIASPGGIPLKRLLPAMVLLLAAAPAFADPLVPVNAIIDLAKLVWSEDPPEDTEYFSPARLSQHYSAGFIEAFKAAEKNPPYGVEEGQANGYPFDYDVITYSQDGCPLEDVKAQAGPDEGKVTSVKVTFRLWACSEDAVEKALVSEVRFDVIEENGRPVIADIKRVFEGETLSLVEEMQDIAKGVHDAESGEQ